MTIQFDREMLIGSTFEAGTEGEETILNPRNGETILKLPEAGAAQIDRAVAAARKAFDGWSRTTPGQRSNLLLKIALLFRQAYQTGFVRKPIRLGLKPLHLSF